MFNAAQTLQDFISIPKTYRSTSALGEPKLWKNGRVDLDAPNVHETIQSLPHGVWKCAWTAKGKTMYCTYEKKPLRPNRSRKWDS